MLTVKPDQVCRILNGEQSVIIKKRFPKDYQGWVYIYCTKRKPYMHWDFYDPPFVSKEWFTSSSNMLFGKEQVNTNGPFNGKVVARFYCDKTENLMRYANCFKDNHFYDLLKGACWNEYGIQRYLGNHTKSAYAINVSKVEVFDKPKEIKAPKNYYYIED